VDGGSGGGCRLTDKYDNFVACPANRDANTCPADNYAYANGNAHTNRHVNAKQISFPYKYAQANHHAYAESGRDRD
jgi:hypothetical protein